jgi:peptidoglycan/LPS O-acetylase OafA/YrhL
VRSVFGFFGGVLLSRVRTRVPTAWLGTGYVLPSLIIATLFLTPRIGAQDWMIQVLAVVVVFPLCIARVVCNPQPDVPRVLRTVGIASYPLYLLHLPLAHGLDILTHKQLTHLAPYGGIGLLALTFVAAVLTAKYVDPPLRRAVGTVVFNRTAIPALKPSQARG